MDFGIGFISNNIMLPILDFFYGIVPSYGLAIVALTLVIRASLYPLNAGSIRNMRKMKVTQPLMKKRQDEIQKRYKDDPKKQQEEMAKLMKEFNPLAGCLPLLFQMPILFALFATLRGSPFTDISYTVDLQIFPQEQLERIQPQAYTTSPQNIYVDDGVHYQVLALSPNGNKLIVGDKTKVEFQTVEGKSLNTLIEEYNQSEIKPSWTVTKGSERVQIDQDGNLVALQAGEVTVQGTITGIASNKGFLFIKALGRVGAFDENGAIHWDILIMVIGFGVSIYASQTISGQGPGANNANPNQDSINKITPILFSGIFLFTPLPAGVLLYMLIANIFQTIQAYILSKEPLPENLQKLVEESQPKTTKVGKGRQALPFESGRSKKKA
ncbi:MAG: membrane protein insertase YidC [Trichodesmium sp. St15_bin1_1]|jgi:membrane protein insertase, YidC/Oxa1 family, C-terminal domain|nr:membrane protein insertase YidC [Trichodesmium sp. St5_bin2_1]MDE5080705.1 membrane protein insertase YidC [Trichodesmium sp. St18_bin1]MDE5087470.1 membrane protein insertase YidC [Trichodesmium sp. St16_bin2-tuft]MDE5106308.1 membrane protein insertase YidC [Trichodesmium sp. St17_bin3_1_1]MDE5115164.1 membrane protein insertase YidC [Trichodesmium sp. St15_bin1_1]MDE5122513.1 membrane protein insertase YidC [Trichodesmium sp. St19_bin1]